MYKCEICNKEYENIKDRVVCETNCLKERELAEEKRKAAELEAKKESRKAEVEMAYENYVELLRNYVEDYGVYSSRKCSSSLFPRWTDFFTY